jgi:hypothetical protein
MWHHNTTGSYFHQRRGVFYGCFEELYRVATGALINQSKGLGQDALCSGLLAVLHQPRDHHRGQSVVELGIRQDWAFFCCVAAGHRPLGVEKEEVELIKERD